jgi:hypothetical protein
MYRHRLRRVLNPTRAAESSVRAQGIIGIPMSRSAALDAIGVPVEHGIQQTHLAGMRNVSSDPAAI